MDIQLNKGPNTLRYLCRYLSKNDSAADFAIVDESNADDLTAAQRHFRGRNLGIVEAVFDVCSFHKEQSSKAVVYISTSLPGEEYRTIRRRQHMSEANGQGDGAGESVVYKTHLAEVANILRWGTYREQALNEIEGIANNAEIRELQTNVATMDWDVSALRTDTSATDADHEVLRRLDMFSPSQYTAHSNALAAMEARTPVLIHGSAGHGKSFVLDTMDLHFQNLGYKLLPFSNSCLPVLDGAIFKDIQTELVYHPQRSTDLALMQVLQATLDLKIGCSVMLIQNLDIENGWVNGQLCSVVAFEDDVIHISATDDPSNRYAVTRVKCDVDDIPYSRTQFPLTLGYALTIHKVQVIMTGL
ncbi:hypothetical protein BDB00DRAFT_793478 [Zychaea mexicana]|uniref:uncharacterized protein n=1 Tax=Zychaea mexicana TaxID=64656 RepID=UPI0022FE9549|nr:uncharacterized protein BDB00DRAFT_793478 [Zychaea mexicana]KAI9473375.1 hypothetical protein BDB00DRAFT_793478 [Zychaea mexicana]